jgi:hypothetical protein
LPNVKDEPRAERAHRVRHSEPESIASNRFDVGSHAA